jgi:hypothetical protein
MSDIIRFLERLGGDAQWRFAPDATMEAALNEAGLDPEQGAALLAGDAARLQALLGCAPLMAVQLPAEEEEEEQEDESEEAPAPDSLRREAALA